jgi:acyl-CoA synthetase (NDP forming)
VSAARAEGDVAIPGRARHLVEVACGAGRRWLTDEESGEILRAYGVPLAREAHVRDVDAAVDAAARLGFPVVLKMSAPDVARRADVRGVRPGLADAAEVRLAFEAVRDLAGSLGERWDGVLVQEQLAGEVELILGARRDRTFGPVVLVGFGGVLAEVLDDTAVRLAPVSLAEAHGMLGELRGARLLTGYRGRGVDREALAALLVGVGRLASELPVDELDLNLVIARPGARGIAVVDRRLTLGSPLPPPEPTPGTRAAVRRLLDPAAVAVIGASRDAAKIGSRALRFLLQHGYGGRVFAVNPRGEPVAEGVPSLPSIAALPDGVDLALVAVPPDACEDVVRDCGARGIPAAVVFTSGFAEAGREDAERRLVAAARAGGVRLCGPNTLGVLNPGAGFCASFSGALVMTPVPGGDLAYVSQSGALGGSLLSRLWELGIGVCRFVSVGNQADLDAADFVDALVDEPEVRVLALFLEGVRDGAKLLRALRNARTRGKPVVVYKAGRTPEGQKAVRSHTGVLAGDDAVWGAALRQAGAVRVTDALGLFDAATALAWQRPPAGPRVGIVSTSGGACGILADECRRHGLAVPELPEATRRRVAAEIPAFGAAANPVDVTAQMLTHPGMFRNVVQILAEEPTIDAVILMLTTLADPLAEDVAVDLAQLLGDLPKPVLVSWIIARSLAARGMRRLTEARIPVYDTPERAVAALAALRRWATLGDHPECPGGTGGQPAPAAGPLGGR